MQSLVVESTDNFLQVNNGVKVFKVKVNQTTTTILSNVFNLQSETIHLIGDDSVAVPDPVTFEVIERGQHPIIKRRKD